MLKNTFLFMMILSWFGARIALGQIPETISYQGILTGESGTAAPDGRYDVTFRIYEMETGGTPLWEETHQVSVTGGIFNAVLGSITPMKLPFDQAYFLGISVGESNELEPRIGLTASPYSLHARTIADGAVTETKLAANTVTTEKIADAAVTEDKLAPEVSLPPGGQAGGDLTGSYPNPVIADNAVTSGKIATAAVTGDKLADQAVTGEKIANGALEAGMNVTILRQDNGALEIAATGGAGLSAVEHDNTLNGDGTTSSPLQIAAPLALTSGANSGTIQATHNNGNYGELGSRAYGVRGISNNGNFGFVGSSETGVFGQHNNGNRGELGGDGYGVAGFNNNGNVGSLGGNAYAVRGLHRNGNLAYIGGNTASVYGRSFSGFAGDFEGSVRITNQGDGAVLLNLSSDRSWAFRQLGTDAGTALELASVGGGGNKYFIINTLGRVGIGTTSPEEKLHVDGNVLADAHTTPSSRRFKSHIQTLESALEKVKRMRGVSFNWKADGRQDIGLIAEEVGGVVPEVVSYEPNDKDAISVDYARLVALLIEAVKEQQREIDELKAAVNELRRL